MKTSLKTLLSFLTGITVMLVACGAQHSATLDLQGPVNGVDMGPQGNADTAAIYQSYLRKNRGCQASSGNNQRVLVTGFGMFIGVKYNISGLVVDNMRSEKFWPNQTYISDIPNKNLRKVADGKLSNSDRGGSVTNRTLVIDNKSYDFCFLLVDVRWDLAAAIIVHEMEKFQPNLVVMSGRSDTDKAIIEGAARNWTSPITGYLPSGKIDKFNLPLSERTTVLPVTDPGVQNEIKMTWDNQELRRATANLIDKIGFGVDAPVATRDASSYVCNNVSFVAAHAAKGVRLNLAGGSLVLNPVIKSNPKVGFLHYPLDSKDSAKEVYAWSQVLATIVTTSLK